MAKNIFDPATYQATIARLEALRPEDEPQWGRMSPAQMLDHMVHYMEIVLGQRAQRRIGNAMTAAVARALFIDRFPFPKNLPTGNAMRPAEAPELQERRARLKELLAQAMEQRADGQPFPPNVVFGKLSFKQYGKVIWTHLDHHLRQFGR